MNIIAMLIGFLVLMIVFVLLMTVPLWLLWNWLMPVIFGLPEITLFQSLGLLMLASILFKSNVSSGGKK